MATISDVAKAAGVSPSTVSYVLSGKRSISTETKERVEQAIRELDYLPHAGARALASSRTWTLGLMAPLRPGANVAMVMQFVTGVVTRARAYDMNVLLLTQDDLAGISRAAHASMVDAFVMMDIEAQDPRVPILVGTHRPAVLIGLPEDRAGLPVVDLDFEAACRIALEHLVGLGHTKIGLIGPPSTELSQHRSYADRLLTGYRAAADLVGVEAIVESAEADNAGGAAAMRRLLDEVDGLTAVVVHNEPALPGVLNTLQRADIEIGQGISVVALCPPEVALEQVVPLTSVDIPVTKMGEIAVDLAMDWIDNGEPGDIELVVPELTVRASTTPRPPRVRIA